MAQLSKLSAFLCARPSLPPSEWLTALGCSWNWTLFLLEQKELNCYSGNCEIWEVMGEGRGDFWGAKKKRKTQSATLCPPLLWQLFAALPVDTVFLLLSVVCVKSILSGSHLLRTCKQWVSHFRAQNITRVCSQFFSFFFFFTGDNFYSYTAPDEVLSLLVLKPSSKHFPLPVQRWISLEECTTTDSHFLLDMTELPLLGQLI